MVKWAEAERTGIPCALGLAVNGKSAGEIARELGIAESSLTLKDMSAQWPSVDKKILDALTFALKGKSIQQIVVETGVPAASLYSIRKHGPYEHRNRSRDGRARTMSAPRAESGISKTLARQKPNSQSLDVMEMDSDLREMARRSYGYGRWDAPYWFIGPEQGQGDEDLTTRLKAWIHFGKRELDDCRDFHLRIGEQRWHGDAPQLQPTWRRLMLLFMNFLGRPDDDASLLKYQRDEWGRLNGETCVIELAGLAAKSYKVPRDRTSFRQERIKFIRDKMLLQKPKLVVMYGVAEKRHWEAITEQRFPPENILILGQTVVAQLLHPMAHGQRAPDSYWKEWGNDLAGLGGE
jgi:hypothetical protein